MIDTFKTDPIPQHILRSDESLFTYDDIVEQEVIAHGGTCVTIKCVLSTKNGGSVIAIKRPRENQDVCDIRRRLTRREAIIANHVGTHTNNIGVIDWGREKKQWIAMEYANGGTLADRIDNMSFIESLWTAIHVTRGLRYAHRNGIYHFDLKPENIAFKSYGDLWDTPKIIDWGAAQATKGGPFPYMSVKNRNNVAVTYRKENGKLVSPHLTPEIILPDEKRDNRTDIYVLSSIFYRLLSGRHKYPPVTSEESGEKVFKKRHIIDKNKTPKQPSTVADIPSSIDDILLKALERYKEDRYQDIYWFERDMMRVYNEEKESKHPPVY